MKSFVEHLANYAEYHRDPRNIRTHLIGVPMIVLAVIILLSRPQIHFYGFILSPALLVYVLAMGFYFKLDKGFALLMAILMGTAIYAGNHIAQTNLLSWLGSGMGLFVGGWIIQFIGHYFEGKKPAFVDDLVGLLIGPLFVTAEILFAFGLYRSLQEQIEQRAGVVAIHQR